jgi:outer membrane immunogenic protein
MYKRILLAGVASAFVTSGAFAADIIAPSAFDWTGPYVGLQGGYAWGDNDVVPQQLGTGDGIGAGGNGRDVGVFPERDGSIDMDGFVGGLHAGYNWQLDSLILGVEGDIELADIKGDTDIVGANDAAFGEASQEIDWLGSLRLRGGFAFDRALLYVTGGLAVGGVDARGSLPDALNSEFASSDDTEWGWTLGGGLEYALTNDLSARIEYRYTDLGDTDVDFADNGLMKKLEFENTFHAVRAGLSWHF